MWCVCRERLRRDVTSYKDYRMLWWDIITWQGNTYYYTHENIAYRYVCTYIRTYVRTTTTTITSTPTTITYTTTTTTITARRRRTTTTTTTTTTTNNNNNNKNNNFINNNNNNHYENVSFFIKVDSVSTRVQHNPYLVGTYRQYLLSNKPEQSTRPDVIEILCNERPDDDVLR